MSIPMKLLDKAHQSLSDQDEEDSSEACEDGVVYRVADDEQPTLPAAWRWVPRCLRFGSPVEATGLSVDNWALGPIFMSSMFLGPALLQLATEAAGCEYFANNDDQALSVVPCDNKVYGFRPSSLLTNMAVVAGLLVPVTLPVVGAIVDHTDHRRQVAGLTALGLSAVKGLEVTIGPQTWFFVTVLQVFSIILYNVHVTSTYAYNSELSSLPEKQARYNAFYSMVQYCSMLSFVITVLLLSGIFQTNDVNTARISQTITALTGLILFSYSWHYLFRDRPATSAVQPGQSLVTTGFTKVWDSFQRIARQYHALFWVIMSLMFAEAGMAALAAIATTFASHTLGMNASEIGVLFLTVLVAGIPGSWLGGWTTVWLKSAVRSAILCNVLFVLITAAAAQWLQGPEHKNVSYLTGALWGITMGWLSPVDTTMFISVMPKDSRAEFMGIYMLAVSILGWLPPLVFSMLNEAGISMAWGLASLDLYFILATVCLLFAGDYHKAVRDVQQGGESVEMLANTKEGVYVATSSDDQHELT